MDSQNSSHYRTTQAGDKITRSCGELESSDILRFRYDLTMELPDVKIGKGNQSVPIMIQANLVFGCIL
jgi:hypothetical protein